MGEHNIEKNQLFNTSHILILGAYTFFSVILIGESLLMSWEKWALIVIGAALVMSWIIHIKQTLDPHARLWVYSLLMMGTFFFYGVHETSTFDLAVIMSALIILYTMTGIKELINLCLLTYYLTMIYELILMIRGGTMFDALVISRVVVHLVVVFMTGWFARTIIDKWTKVLDESMKEIDFLKDATTRLDDFLANVSHEIRTPVNAVIGLSGVCIEKDVNGAFIDDLNAIQEAGKKVGEQISDILDYSEIDRKILVRNDEDYMLDSVLNDLVMRLRPYKRRDIELIIDVNPSIPAVMNGDINKLKKILWHLIMNGLKYTREGGVYVRLSSTEQSYGINLCIEVTDTGIGMSEEELERITERFYQADSGRSRMGGGLGLGIPIVNGFVIALGGFMTVHSQPGEGTTIRVSVPQKVVDPAGCMSLLRRESLCLGAYLHFDKYPDPNVREYYNRMVSNIVHGLNAQMHRVDNVANLKRLVDSVRLTHLFVAEEEYKSDPSYIEELARETEVIVVADDDFTLPAGSRARIMEKPFYCFPVTTVLNLEPGVEERDVRMQCKGIKALVVDDEPMNLTVAKGIFKGYGMEVTVVLSGQEAIDLCRKKRFDIVFMDHMMPGMDGIEAMKAIKADRHSESRDMPIVALTANAVSTAKEMFISAGFDGFVSKPVEITELERVLKRVLPKSAVTYESISPDTFSGKYSRGEGTENKRDDGDGNERDGADGNGQDSINGNQAASEAAIDNNAGRGDSGRNTDKGNGSDSLAAAGIDREAGLKYTQNDSELYETILRQFVTEAPVKREKISSYFREEDYKNYEIYVHALKSTARMIGASELSERAKELEDEAKKGGSGITQRMHDEMMELYEKTVTAAAQSLGMETELHDSVWGAKESGGPAEEGDTVSDTKPFVLEFEPGGEE